MNSKHGHGEWRSAPRRRAAQVSVVIVAAMAVLVLGVAAAFTIRGWSGDGLNGGSGTPDSFVARKGSFDITIPVNGELEALRQTDIRNFLDSRAVITEIVPEGAVVQKGDVLIRLNDEDIRNRFKDAKDQVNESENEVKTAESNLAIKKSTRESELEKADVEIVLAELALQAWKEGTDVSKRKELDLSIETADMEFLRLEKRFADSGRLLEQKFISEDEYKRDEIAMIEAKAKIEQARLDREVYQKYTSVEEFKKLESNLEQAKAERGRVAQRNDAAVESAASDLQSSQAQLESARTKAEDLEQQLAACTIFAPADGLVVYYSSTQTGGMGRNEGRPPQVGTEITRNEPVIILPDTSQMVAAVKVSEALVGQIKSGHPAVVTCDALPEQPFDGDVSSVGVLAESGGWRDPNRRDYKVKIRLNYAGDLDLKPSMRCKAVINVGRVDTALHIPIQAVFRNGPIAYVHVPYGRGYAQRKITTGRSSELFTEITEGLSEGETVLLREPAQDEVLSRIEVPKDRLEEFENVPAAAPAENSHPTGSEAGMPRGMGEGGSPMMRNGGMRRNGGEGGSTGQNREGRGPRSNRTPRSEGGDKDDTGTGAGSETKPPESPK